jgi:hypothetical protein
MASSQEGSHKACMALQSLLKALKSTLTLTLVRLDWSKHKQIHRTVTDR